MGIIQVKKVVAVCFLEATKMTLDHLGEYRLSLSQQGVRGAADLPRIYGEARRLRDYLQRCASAYPDLVALDLSDGDRTLLVACCRRAVEVIESRLMDDQPVSPDERQFLQRKRTVLGDWAVELADKPPLLELPMPRVSQVHCAGAKALMTRLHQKLFPSRSRVPLPAGLHPASPTAGVPSIVGEAPVPPAAGDEYAPPKPLEEVVEQLGRDSVPPPAATEVEAPLLESNKLRDPLLRSLVALDLRSYSRSLQAQDFRLATVLLASILEASVLDHAIPRRCELGLTATPETWNPQEVLVKVMGTDYSPKDRSVAYYLFASRNLLRPGLQMITPTVVTRASLERMVEFVKRALYAMGFSSNVTGPQAHLPAHMLSEARSIGSPQPD